VQVEFNYPIANDTTNSDIIESKEKVAETKVDRDERIKSMLKEATQIHLMLV
jgi:hypothetical protein